MISLKTKNVIIIPDTQKRLSKMGGQIKYAMLRRNLSV